MRHLNSVIIGPERHRVSSDQDGLPTLAMELMVTFGVIGFSIALAQAQLTPKSRAVEAGVVIEAVKSGLAPDVADLKAGDVVLSWSRRAEAGRIDSPFDWMDLEIEQIPRGPVTVLGVRDSHSVTWTFENSLVGVSTRPVLRPDREQYWQRCRELDNAGKSAEAAACWREMIGSTSANDLLWFSPLLEYQLAQSLVGARQFEVADAAFQRAIEQTPSTGWAARALLLQKWGESAAARSDWVQAEEHYGRSLEAVRRLASLSLREAVSRSGEGLVAENQGNFDRAEECYRDALAIREKLAPNSLPVSVSLSDLGNVRYKRGDLNGAEENYRRALAIRQKLAPDSLAVARSLIALGTVAHSRGDLGRAEENLRQALTTERRLVPGSLDVADALNQLGILAGARGTLPQAEDFFQQSLSIRQKLAPGGLGEAGTLSNLGIVAWERGDLARAEQYCRQALAIREKVSPGSPENAGMFRNLGILAHDRGDLARAEEYHQQALMIDRRLNPGSLDVAAGLTNLGVVAQERGDLVRAEEYYQQALSIQSKVAPGSLDVASVLNNLGAIALSDGHPDRAKEYYEQALAIREKLAPGSLDVAESLGNLGNSAYGGRDLARAAEYHERALAIMQKVAPGSLALAQGLSSLGDIARDRGDVAQARGDYEHALAIRRSLSPGTRDEATTLHSLGVLLRKEGELASATADFSSAVDALEKQTAQLGGTEDVRSSFRSKYAAWYLDYQDVLLAQNRREQAYQVSERSRARSLIEMLAERDLVFPADIPAELQRSRKQNAVQYDQVQSRLAALRPASDQKKIDGLLARLRELNAERGQIAEAIKKTSPRFASLQYPQPLDLPATRQVLDPGTTLLSYSVSEAYTTLFVVKPEGSEPGFSALNLPVRATQLKTRVEELRRLIGQRGQNDAGELTDRSSELYDLLVKPAEALIENSTRLLIIPDGPLQVLPFAALRRNDKKYLLEWKPLHTVVSATVYAELKKARQTVSHKDIDLVAFGDPRLPADKALLAGSTNPEVRFASERGFNFVWLPFSKQEVEGIAALFPRRARTYLGSDASEEHAKTVGKDVRYIHFATHGVLDERFPLNSALVLSIPDKYQEGKENGLLQAWEIFEQVRVDADLVTLSACNTGLGQELSGEGLIGLTRAFQYAGAHSVLASLWSVDDFRTMELMKHFYIGLRAGKSKDEALRAAQLLLLHSSPSSSPYYWAAFSLVGNWR